MSERKRASERRERGEKASRGRQDGRGAEGWRLIFCSLASASSSASGRPHFSRARRTAKGGEGPSIILSSVSLASRLSPSPSSFYTSSSYYYYSSLLAPVVFDLLAAAGSSERLPYRRSSRTMFATMTSRSLSETRDTSPRVNHEPRICIHGVCNFRLLD